MLSYKKKLLDRYPNLKAGEKAFVPPPGPRTDAPVAAGKQNGDSHPGDAASSPPAPSENIEALKTAFQAELALDAKRLRKNVFSHVRKDIRTAGLWAGGAAAAFGILGMITGALWMKSTLTPDWNRELAEVQQQASYKLDGYLNGPEFSRLLEEKVGEYSLSVSEQSLAPVLEEARTSSGELRVRSEESLARLETISALTVTLAQAKNDDRLAFERLLEISRDRNHPYREIAGNAISQIYLEVNRSIKKDEHWEIDELRPRKKSNSLEEFQKAYWADIALYRPRRLQDFWATDAFSREEKIAFLISVIRKETSLRALATATSLVDEAAELYKPFTAYGAYLQWWDENRGRFGAPQAEE